jgi:hypothetical protein
MIMQSISACQNWTHKTLPVYFKLLFHFFLREKHFYKMIGCALWGTFLVVKGGMNFYLPFYFYILWFTWYVLKLEHRYTLWIAILIAKKGLCKVWWLSNISVQI